MSLSGSYARRREDVFTDLDVVVVMQSEKPFVERLRWLHGFLGLPVDLDLLCYTPEEFGSLRGSLFLDEILPDEVVLYERRSALEEGKRSIPASIGRGA